MPAGIRLLKSSQNPLSPAPIYSATALPRAVFAQPGTPSINGTVFDDHTLSQSRGRQGAAARQRVLCFEGDPPENALKFLWAMTDIL
jgi:hypothetical protein